MFKIVGKVFPGDAESVRYWSYFTVAVLIDVCGVVALLLVSKKQDATPVAEINYDTNQEQPVVQQPYAKGTYKDDRTGEDLMPVVNKMLFGAYGDKLMFRPILEDWRDIKLRAPSLTALLNQLISEKHVVRQGRSYYLIQGVIS